MELEQIKKIVQETLSEKRFYHSTSVMNRCEELARKYNVDIEIAKKVGIAHDIAKEMTDEEKLNYIKKYNIEIDDIEKNNLGLLHAKIGADIAKRTFNFSQEMCDAIKYHTTAKENMTMLEKILYISDWCGEDRTFEAAKLIREKLFSDGINEAIFYTLNMVIEEQIEKNKQIHINTINARNFLLGEMR